MRLFDGLRSIINGIFNKSDVKQSLKPRGTPLEPQTGIDGSIYLDDDTTNLTREQNYDIFDGMDDESPEVAYALDFIADLATQGDDVLVRSSKIIVDDPNLKMQDTKQSLSLYDAKIKIGRANSHNKMEEVRRIIRELESRTKIKSKLRDFVREGIKYGDFFAEIIFGTDKNNTKMITDFYDIHPKFVQLNTDKFGRLVPSAAYKMVKNEETLATYPEWAMFRLRFGGRSKHTFGKGLAHSARKTYIRMDTMESSMVVGRTVRASQRYVFKVDVDGLGPDKAFNYVKDVKEVYTRRQMVDRAGNIKDTREPLPVEEDIFWPVKKDSASDVHVLEGDQYLSYIDDVRYFSDKLKTALKVSRLGAIDSKGSRNAVSELDTDTIRYMKAIQSVIRESLVDLYKQELKLHGILDVDIEIAMPEISSVTEIRKWEIERTRAEVSKINKEAGVLSDDYIREHVYYMTQEERVAEEEKVEQQKQKDMDRVIQQTQATQPTEPQNTGENPQGGGSARTRTGKNKQQRKAANAYTTPKNATEAVDMDSVEE